MTPTEQFAAWLHRAMQQAGYDVTSQRGGGRMALAERLDVSKSTVSRWLDARSLPSAAQLAPLAEALDLPLLTLMQESGLAPQGDQLSDGESARPITLERAADLLGIPTRQGRDMFANLVEPILSLARSIPEPTPELRLYEEWLQRQRRSADS